VIWDAPLIIYGRTSVGVRESILAISLDFRIQLLLYTLQKISPSRKVLVASKASVFADTRILRVKMWGVDHSAAMREIA